MAALDPILNRLKALWAAVDTKPVTRWGTVATTSPLTVLLDPGMGDPAPARSAIGSVPAGSRVLCVEQNRRITVVGGGDTGWVDVAISEGFAAQNSTERPQVRRIGNEVWWRGGFSSAGFSASSVHVAGVVPVGFRPSSAPAGLAPILVSGAHAATARVQVDGTVDIRTGPSVSGYYLAGGTWLTD